MSKRVMSDTSEREMRESDPGLGDPLFHSMSAKLRSYGVEVVEVGELSSIGRVPPSTLRLDPGAYEPQVVSIGPYHRQNPKLRAMEDHKWSYMHNLLRRHRRIRRSDQRDSPDAILELCIDVVKKSEARARRCYKVPDADIDGMSSDDFVRMLVLDGCFMLELFLKCREFGEGREEEEVVVADHGKMIFTIPWMFPAIWRDLLKMENQIPFFVLQDLFLCTVIFDDGAPRSLWFLKMLAFTYLIQFGPLADPFCEEGEARCPLTGQAEIYHLLHYYHMLLKPPIVEDGDLFMRLKPRDAPGTRTSGSVRFFGGSSSGGGFTYVLGDTSGGGCTHVTSGDTSGGNPSNSSMRTSSVIYSSYSTVKSVLKKVIIKLNSFLQHMRRKQQQQPQQQQQQHHHQQQQPQQQQQQHQQQQHQEQQQEQRNKKRMQRYRGTIPCAVELRDAGIELRVNKKAAKTAVLDVAFDEDGVLHIPPITVDEDTNTVFRNLLALEQFCPGSYLYVTMYTTFLDCIVNSARDVTILQQCGIVDNKLGSEEALAQLINRLGTDVACRPYHHLQDVFEQVNEYCESRWHKYRASCMRDYFGNPWSMISLFAAVALLLMTLTQVVFAILSYRKQL